MKKITNVAIITLTLAVARCADITTVQLALLSLMCIGYVLTDDLLPATERSNNEKKR